MDQYINTKDIRNIFEHLTDEYAYTEFLSGIYVAKSWIEDIKPADVEHVRHGHWINIGSWDDLPIAFKCSVCKRNSIQTSDFCPKCGAKMDGKENEQ